jgi:peptidoglycan-N-acetylglucosamine deacetylase
MLVRFTSVLRLCAVLAAACAPAPDAAADAEIAAAPAPAAGAVRAIPVAVTIDDLPWVGALAPGESQAEATQRILRALNAHGAVATGFVNCGRVRPGAPILQAWLDAGMQLGNHTGQHLDLNRAPLERWLEDARSCDAFLRRETGAAWVPFRFPYLHEGPTTERWTAARRLLDELDSPPAHVTLQTADWVLAAAYGRAIRAGDAALATRIGEEFVEHVERVLDRYEAISQERVGRGIAHVLLLHANALVADHLPAALARLRERGVRFVRLDVALQDPVYALPNDYVGPEGISWLYRFAPAVPDEFAWDAAEERRLRAAFPR